jgi:hypothetical protein
VNTCVAGAGIGNAVASTRQADEDGALKPDF